jgi:hypothetical protein
LELPTFSIGPAKAFDGHRLGRQETVNKSDKSVPIDFVRHYRGTTIVTDASFQCSPGSTVL